MKRQRQKPAKTADDDVPDALTAYGERFMSMFDDYDAQSFKKAKHAATAAGNGQPTESPSSSQQQGSSDSSGGSESEEDSDGQHQHHQQQQRRRPDLQPSSAADSKLQAFLSGRKGNKGIKPAAAQLSQQQLAEQQRQQQQQRMLERKLKKQFMSSKVDKIFSGVDPQQLAAAAGAAAADESLELTPEQFAAMRRDVEQLGATALDKRSAKAYKAAMLARLGASADKRPRIPAKMGLGMAKKAKQREAVALQEAIAAGMVKAKGRGKKERALKAKQRDKGLMEAGPGFKNGVLRLPKSALR